MKILDISAVLNSLVPFQCSLVLTASLTIFPEFMEHNVWNIYTYICMYVCMCVCMDGCICVDVEVHIKIKGLENYIEEA